MVVVVKYFVGVGYSVFECHHLVLIITIRLDNVFPPNIWCAWDAEHWLWYRVGIIVQPATIDENVGCLGGQKSRKASHDILSYLDLLWPCMPNHNWIFSQLKQFAFFSCFTLYNLTWITYYDIIVKAYYLFLWNIIPCIYIYISII